MATEYQNDTPTQYSDSIDIFSMSNPALCGIILWSFSKGYSDNSERGFDYPLLYLPIPLVLSKSITNTLKGTNKRTGLFEWLSRNPDLPIHLSSMVLDTRPTTIESIRFSLKYKLISLNEDNRIIPGINKLNESRNKSSDIESLLKHATLFGAWMGKINSTRLIFQSLGLKL